MKLPTKIEPEKHFAPSKTKRQDLISRNEKVQVEVRVRHLQKDNDYMPLYKALRDRYKNISVKISNRRKLQRLKFFSVYVMPAILGGKQLYS